MNDLERIINLLKAKKRFLITTHIRPDGDAVGSVSGLARALLESGALVWTSFSGPIPDHFAHLLEGIPVLAPDKIIGLQVEALLILDSGDSSRTGIEEQLNTLRCPSVNIDHHGTNPGYGDLNWVDPTASSTAEMIAILLQEAGFPISQEAAKGLYTGIYTDTRFFQNDSVRTETFLVLANLRKTGFNPSPIVSSLTQNKSIIDVKTVGLGLTNAVSLYDGKLVYTVVHHEDLMQLGATAQNCWSGGLFSQLNVVNGCYVAATFVEDGFGAVFCEFRAKYGFDVREVAVAFGGGGHKAASGCSQQRPVEEVVTDVVGFLGRQLQDLPLPQ